MAADSTTDPKAPNTNTRSGHYAPTSFSDGSTNGDGGYATQSDGTYKANSDQDLLGLLKAGVPFDKIQVPTGDGSGTYRTATDHDYHVAASNATDTVAGGVPHTSSYSDSLKALSKETGLPLDAIGGLLSNLDIGGSIDTGALSKAISDSQTLRDQFNVPAVQGTAPTATAAQFQAAQAAGSSPIAAALAAASQATGSSPVTAATAQQQAAIQAQQVQAALAGRTTLGPTSLAGQTTIDQTNANQTRGQQEALAGALQGTINGTTPSVAALLLKQQTEANVANQFALANSAHGNDVGLANFQAMNNAAGMNQQAIGQQALLRAQEIATAQGQLGGVLSNVGSQDANLATNQAQLVQAINLANSGALNTSNMTQAQLDAALAQQNAAAQNQVGLANASNNLAAGTTNATLAQAIALANQKSQNDTGQFNAAQTQQNSQFNTGQLNAIAQANAAAQNNTNQFNSTQTQQNNQFNTGQLNSAATTNANNSTDVSKTNAANDLNQQTINNTATQNAAANTLAAQGQAITGTAGMADAQAKKAAADEAAFGAATGAIISKLSDRRAKKDIAKADADIEDLLAALKSYRYKYKDPNAKGAAPGERFGPMAQDIERSRAGKAMVKDTPNGKMIDNSAALMAALSALGNVDKRLKAVERRAG